MLGWSIVAVILLLLLIFGIIFWNRIDADWFYVFIVTTIVSGLTLLILVPVIVFVPMEVKVKIGTFQSEKAYIENHVAKNEIEDAALTSKKVEENEWLFNSQQSQKEYGIFSFYPSSIQDVEPIQ